ncbi:hypothetical protein Pmar_PMAR006048 [Perkinsus marinus ATCC 50983]|uniref:Sugar phosphate transporter domain-containing protein n=1 Tax=Perkinsus marinus (strain ATCC 50983 / TXsc) TaxID=423536 RepID=C5LA27_PERM5|nr:hypothetical protein Pmar_PMAR006048 [Perkinsus marinus ATCC 50983]EER06283.1 hypothetical protein Pmar_PMAR006048 [Perkinsus marinus ATCC 50983]|eukprot:XP_002774467.1 hypothetical protein Pmar_PMAR006048 [Perkinsus marinus ATCC 50983]
MLADHLIGSVLAFTVEYFRNKDGRRSDRLGMTWRDLKLMTPLAVLYSVSDLSTMQAIDYGNSPTMTVVAQTRLLLVAVLSYYCLGRTMSDLHSLIGVVICALAFTLTEEHVIAPSAIPWSVSKALLSSVCSVYLEWLMKGDSRGFLATAARFKLISFVLTLSGLLLIHGPHNVLGFKPICGSLQIPVACDHGRTCECLYDVGMNLQSWVAFIVIVLNGWITAYVLKSVSATAKYVCSALAAPILYVLSWLAGRREFQPVPFLLVCLLVLQVSVYSRNKTKRGRSELTKVVSTGDFGEWLQGYRVVDVPPSQIYTRGDSV